MLQRQTGAMKCVPTNRERRLMQVLCRGRGPKDANVKKLPAQLRAQLKAAMADVAPKLKAHPRDILWRIDRNGTIHFDRREISI